VDPRTRIMLFKMLNSGILEEINGIVSTGKEASVYHAKGPNRVPDDDVSLSYQLKRMLKFLVGGEYAIKIFKTTLNEFKNREEYMVGEFRFRHDKFSHQNPRKVIKLWAQKEMRNLKRIFQIGIPCPLPVLLREHVLVMTFIGKNGVAAPHLKDISATEAEWTEIRYEAFKIIRKLYQQARLVHADLSEFNILYFNKKVYIIDVSQAVENDHPNSLEFLRRDCLNMTRFFRSKGFDYGMTAKQLFEFVTERRLDETTLDQYITRVEAKNKINPQVDDEVFLQSYIPRTLAQVGDPMQEMLDLQAGNSADVFHMSVTGLIPPSTEALDEDPLTTTDDEE